MFPYLSNIEDLIPWEKPFFNFIMIFTKAFDFKKFSMLIDASASTVTEVSANFLKIFSDTSLAKSIISWSVARTVLISLIVDSLASNILASSTSSSSYASFKIVLHQTSNDIDFIYGSTMDAAGTLTASIGLNGANSFLSVTIVAAFIAPVIIQIL